MTASKKNATSKGPNTSNVSPQTWALTPMVSMVGMAGWAEMMKEGVQFLSERIERDMKAQRDFLSCTSPEEALRVQSEYCKDVVAQYAGQFQRMAELFSQTTALGWSEATASRARKYDDVPL